MDKTKRFPRLLPRPWFQYLPLALALRGRGRTPDSTRNQCICFRGCVHNSLLYLQSSQRFKTYIMLLTTFLTASIAYNVFFYFPILSSPQGIDAWGYIAVAAAITRTGHFSNIAQPTDVYYTPFPVMSIAPAILSSMTGLSLQSSVLIFPGSLILLQPLLVFLVARVVYENPEAAAISGLIVVAESLLIQIMASPLAESVAISLFLLVLVTVLQNDIKGPCGCSFGLLFDVGYRTWRSRFVVCGTSSVLDAQTESVRVSLNRVFILLLAAYFVVAGLLEGMVTTLVSGRKRCLNSLYGRGVGLGGLPWV